MMYIVFILLGLILTPVAFMLGYRLGIKRKLMNPQYPPELSGIYLGALFAAILLGIGIALIKLLSWMGIYE